MLRELDMNEMEMVAGGENSLECPDNEVVATGSNSASLTVDPFGGGGGFFRLAPGSFSDGSGAFGSGTSGAGIIGPPAPEMPSMPIEMNQRDDPEPMRDENNPLETLPRPDPRGITIIGDEGRRIFIQPGRGGVSVGVQAEF